MISVYAHTLMNLQSKHMEEEERDINVITPLKKGNKSKKRTLPNICNFFATNGHT
jgi:hypothetical protein